MQLLYCARWKLPVKRLSASVKLGLIAAEQHQLSHFTFVVKLVVPETHFGFYPPTLTLLHAGRVITWFENGRVEAAAGVVPETNFLPNNLIVADYEETVLSIGSVGHESWS